MRKKRLLAGALAVLLAGGAAGRAGLFCSSCHDRPCCSPSDSPTFGYNPVLWNLWPGTSPTTEPPRAAPQPATETTPVPRIMPPADAPTASMQPLNLSSPSAPPLKVFSERPTLQLSEERGEDEAVRVLVSPTPVQSPLLQVPGKGELPERPLNLAPQAPPLVQPVGLSWRPAAAPPPAAPPLNLAAETVPAAPPLNLAAETVPAAPSLNLAAETTPPAQPWRPAVPEHSMLLNLRDPSERGLVNTVATGHETR